MKNDMLGRVDKLADARKTHFNTIENLDLKQIKLIVSIEFIVVNLYDFLQKRRSYVPRRKTREELYREAKSLVKASWKDSGIGGDQFSRPPIMKPKLLDPWTLGRVQAPEKASTKFFFSKYHLQSIIIFCF